MSPALAHEFPDTPPLALSCKPRVRVRLCMPRGFHSEGAPTHAPVEAPCSMLAVDTVEERLCPCKCRSAMLHTGHKQLWAAHGCINLREPLRSVSSLAETLSLRESHARGLGTGATLR